MHGALLQIMIVTDLAARGIDIPLLDNVINYHFPPTPKLFVHRVGRVARAGRGGTAYSLISTDEDAYLIDLHMFLGRTLTYAPSGGVAGGQQGLAGGEEGGEKWEDGVYGAVPQDVIDGEEEAMRAWHEKVDLQNGHKVFYIIKLCPLVIYRSRYGKSS